MRGGVVAAGVVLMIVGAFLLFFLPGTGFTGVGGTSGSNPISDVLLGIVVGFIGFIVLIAGLAASPDLPPQTIYIQQPHGYRSFPPQFEARASEQPVARFHGTPSETRPDPQSLEGARASAAFIEGTQSLTTAFCPYCGAPGKSEFRYCRSCGKEMPLDS